LDYEDHGYRDPLFPPSLLSHGQAWHLAWLVLPLLALSMLATTTAATLINHQFVVRGLAVAADMVPNARARAMVAPLLAGVARSWPKFVLGILGYFVALSDIGLGAIVSSVMFSFHVTLGLGLVEQRSVPSDRKVVALSWAISQIFVCLLIAASLNQYSSGYAFHIIILVFFLLVALLHLYRKPEVQATDLPMVTTKEEEAEKSPPGLPLLPRRPQSILAPGATLSTVFLWTEYLATAATALPPRLTLLCCLPDARKSLWPLAVLGGGLWVAVLLYFSVWSSTELGEMVGVPPEVMGLVVLGPILSLDSLLHIQQAPLVEEATGSLLNSVFYGLTLPALIYLAIRGQIPVIASEGLETAWSMLAINIFLTHLILLFQTSSCCSSYCGKIQGLLLILFYIVIFIPIMILFTYAIISVPY